jgi:hypothetical protein
MSQRHRESETPSKLPRQERRAHAHSERHRIHVELQSVAQGVSSGMAPEDLHEPGMAWKPEHQRDSDVAKSKLAKQHRVKRHWKTKMWKRRTQLRESKIEMLQMSRENSGMITG